MRRLGVNRVAPQWHDRHCAEFADIGCYANVALGLAPEDGRWTSISGL